ncbi:MAG: DNA topoisomerase IV subunit A [Labilithrix sp.]|nr:DNA topoisomerase IV subunit A [Labilithrix sp.]MBX3220030.1 DNA topoisomerase IV subunit A [Labilithrix sp.]
MAAKKTTSNGTKKTGSGGGPARGGKGRGKNAPVDLFAVAPEEQVPLHDLAQTRYLNYALSVITSRALPDVRDGLKPVQRRILYTMWQQRLFADAKHRKCATVVGAVMGNYHPHGDSSIYDALVRQAQPFAMRIPLVEGSGNFGSLDGDPAAAMRYTECRLEALSAELLTGLAEQTVHYRPNYDGTKSEPVVLPAKLPNLLINGATGIAVGMATNIPPHNPEEVCAASIRLLDALLEGKQLSSRELTRTIKGPDFPTGGQIVSSTEELKQIYETGQGSIKVRATWEPGTTGRASKTIYITSIPYATNKAVLVERIADVVLGRKMPLLLDVKDVSTEDVRIELELKKEADEQKVLAYLFKNTPLQSNFAVNLTCLVPTENPDVGRPERLDLRSMLWHYLHFRLEVVTKRLQHELASLAKRMHILQGFATVFDALDQIIKIIRASDGKADAAKKIMARFKLDDEQTDAILELRLYRLARLEILVIQEELKDKKKRSGEIKKLLAEEGSKGIWGIVRGELEGLSAGFGKLGKRRTIIEAVGEERTFSEEELIIAEDNHVLLTRDGWVKRQREIKDPAATRLREGDGVLAVVAGSTKSTVVFFSSYGTAYTCRIAEVPATTGYGEPIQKLFKMKDGESIVAMASLDPRVVGKLSGDEQHYPETYALAASSDGNGLTFSLEAFLEPSTRSGRKYARLGENAAIVGVEVIGGEETVIAVSKKRRALLCDVGEVKFLASAGKGVQLMKLADDDALLAIKAAKDDRDTLTVKTSLGGEQRINTGRYKRTGRGGKGHEVISRGALTEVVLEPPVAPEPFTTERPPTIRPPAWPKQ